MLEPVNKEDTAFVFEFKVLSENEEKRLNKDTLDEGLVELAKIALAQIEIKEYEVELKKKGYTNIIKVGFGFKGKQVKVLMKR